MKVKAALWVILLCLLTEVLFAQENSGAVSRVFAVNLWTQAVDVSLGKDGIFATDNLAPNNASQMVVFSSMIPRSILYRTRDANEWQENKVADGKVLYYRLEAGRNYLILVQNNGQPALFDLSAPASNKARLLVLNATGRSIPDLQVATSYNLGIVAYAKDFGPGWTNFIDVPNGNYGAFWSLPDMPNGLNYYYSSGRDSQALGLTVIKDNAWYVLVLWHDDLRNLPGAAFFDISPVQP